ncbi:Pex2 / Pex12 amino terminal region family protein [Coccidioides posadasii C735 delta SOWgp]|uniref:RING-type E3 ubiquitin transferase n=1 Tax=Coccidioides posadasii (strain C735) TaxID=222929 RepID=C5PBH2_COCP7|nr:Pex2 / Pex12 amino terminal region family protein [Coccidioides posadasii C735 delta SOWgp]EER25956.1 Pex2 / Pex12 amino terminal region family protein [Coccidioides posadasii C735 delta SOWgp]|eukprot:XP_003068101.1 Pex2 / Pex12 amino terminal region family protein [Coccidioides posadasii C735 delta SOWgp]
MSSDDSQHSSSSPPSSKPTTSHWPTSHFFPWATSPDIIRAHEKDAYITGTLSTQVQSIVRTLRGARFAHAHTDAIKNLTDILYLSLTTLVGNRTLGEEYCDVVQLEDDSLRFPSLARRAGYILSSILMPWTLQRILPAFRRRLRAKLERSIARKQAKSVYFSKEEQQKKRQNLVLKFQTYILEHLDSLTSLSPVYAIHLAAFYFTGAYYHISKRLWGLRYVFSKRIEESEERVGYEVLGVLMVLQIVVQGIVHVKEVVESIQEDTQSKDKHDFGSHGQPGTTLKSICNPPSIPSLTPDTPRYDLSSDAGTALSWIPAGQQRKCTLCLEPFKDPSVSTCGHVFCWTCIRDWVREKPECPLCRQEALGSKILPLRG